MTFSVATKNANIRSCKKGIDRAEVNLHELCTQPCSSSQASCELTLQLLGGRCLCKAQPHHGTSGSAACRQLYTFAIHMLSPRIIAVSQEPKASGDSFDGLTIQANPFPTQCQIWLTSSPAQVPASHSLCILAA